MFDKVCKTGILESFNIKSLLLWIGKSQPTWCDHLRRLPQELLPKQMLYAEVNGKMSVCLPWTE